MDEKSTPQFVCKIKWNCHEEICKEVYELLPQMHEEEMKILNLNRKTYTMVHFMKDVLNFFNSSKGQKDTSSPYKIRCSGMHILHGI